MDKVWYIKINGLKEGPYSLKQLNKDPRFTPDTLVWREGFENWIPARYLEELRELFKDSESKPLHELNLKKKPLPPSEEIALDLHQNNFPFLFYWILLMMIILAFILYKISL
jgi:hypothetical protein